MTTPKTVVAFRLDRATLDRLEEVRRALAQRNPGLCPSRTDAFKFLVATGSGSVLAAAEPMRQTA